MADWRIERRRTALALALLAAFPCTALAATGSDGVATLLVRDARTATTLEMSVTDPDLAGRTHLDALIERRGGRAAPDDMPREVQVVRLHPVPGRPATFAGALPTREGEGADGTVGWVEASDNAINATRGDRMTLRYADRLTADGGAADRTATVTIGADGPAAASDRSDVGSGPALSIGAPHIGGPMSIAVIDPMRDAPAIEAVVERRDAAGVMVEWERVRLSLVDAAGRFAAPADALRLVSGATADPNPGNGRMNAAPGDEFVLRYASVDGAERTARATTMGGRDARIEVAALGVGAALGITVADDDLTDALDVTVLLRRVGSDDAPGGALAVVVPRRSPVGAPGRFSLPATDPDAARTVHAETSARGALSLRPGDTVEAVVRDDYRTDGSAGPVTATITVPGGSDAVVRIAGGSHRVGDALALRIRDADLAGRPHLDVTVERLSPDGPDAIRQVRLLTDLNDDANGTFAGIVITAAHSRDAGPEALRVTAGDVVVLRYHDASSADGRARTREASVVMNGGTTATLALRGEGTVGALRAGDALAVTLNDPDRTTTPTVTLTAGPPGAPRESRSLRLDRIAPGRFAASVPTRHVLDAGADALPLAAGDVLVVTHADEFAASGAPEIVRSSRPVLGGADGAVRLAVGRPGSPLSVSVHDTDLDGAARATVDLTVIRDERAVASRTIDLPRAAGGAGSFALDAVPTRIDDGTAPTDGALALRAGDVLVATYADRLRRDGSRGPTTADAVVSGGARAALSVEAGAPGMPVLIELRDPDGTGPRTVTIDAGGEWVEAKLREIEPGTFATSVRTRGPDGDPAPGALTVRVGDTIDVSHRDPSGPDGVEATVTASARIRGGERGGIAILAPSPHHPARIILHDPDLAGVEVVAVEVEGPGGERESVALEEGTAGRFAGTLALEPDHDASAPRVSHDGRVLVSPGTVLTARYTDITTPDGTTARLRDEAVVGGADTGSLLLAGGGAGAPIHVTLLDTDLSGSGPVTVPVRGPGGRVNRVALTERVDDAGRPTGAFEGVLGPTATAVPPGTVLRAAYTDERTAAGTRDEVAAAITIRGGATGTLSLAAGLPGEPVRVSLTDPDLAGAGSHEVLVANGDDRETTVINEIDPGTFTGLVPTMRRARAIAGDGALIVRAGDTVRALYADALTDGGEPREVVASALVRGGETGVVVASGGVPGDPLRVTLVDADLAGAGPVDLVATAGGVQRTFALVEDAGQPGTLAGEVPTVFADGQRDADELPVKAGTRVSVAYADAVTADGEPGEGTDTVTIAGGTTATLALAGGRIGDAVRVSLVDPDLAGAPSVEVRVRNDRTGEERTVVAIPDGRAGRFAGTLATVPGGATTGRGKAHPAMAALTGDTISAHHDDRVGPDGGPVRVAASVAMTGGATARLELGTAVVGEAVRVTLVDADLASSASAQVEARVPATGERLRFPLRETAPGRFEGAVPLAAERGNAPSLRVEAGAMVEVIHADGLRADGSRGEAVAVTAVRGGVTGTLELAADGHDAVAITLRDADLAGRTGVTVALSPGRAASREIVTLRPHPSDGTLFTGRVALAPAGRPDDPLDGVLHAVPDAPIIATYDDARTSPGGAGSVVATLSTGGRERRSFPPRVGVANGWRSAGIDAVATLRASANDSGGIDGLRASGAAVYGRPVAALHLGFERGGGAMLVTLVEPSATEPVVTLRTASGRAERVALRRDPTAPGTHIARVVVRRPGSAGDGLLVVPGEAVHVVHDLRRPPGGTVRLRSAVAAPRSGTQGVAAIPATPKARAPYAFLDRHRASLAPVRATTVPPANAPAAPTSSVHGRAWHDLDHDGRWGALEVPVDNWLVEAEQGGRTVASGATGRDGSWRLEDVPAAPTTMRLRAPTGTVWTIAAVTPGMPDPVELPAAPTGVLYDALTREPVRGAILEMRDGSGEALPGTCLAHPSQRTQRVGADGRYRIELRHGAHRACPRERTIYRLAAAAPGSTAVASALLPPEIDALDPSRPGASDALVGGDGPPRHGDAVRYHAAFAIASGDAPLHRRHLPIDASPAPRLVVATEPLDRSPGPDGTVRYRVRIANRGATIANATLAVVLPEGMRYVSGSAMVDGGPVPARLNGRRLELRRLTVPARRTIDATMATVADGTARRAGPGMTPRIWMMGEGGHPLSNVSAPPVASPTRPPPDCTTFAGRVFVDENGDGRADANEPGLPDVVIETMGDRPVLSGADGGWHVPCALVPLAAHGRDHPVLIDPDTVPPGYLVVTETPIVATLQPGGPTRVDVPVLRLGEIRLDVSATAFAAGIRLRPAHGDALASVVGQLAARPSRLRLVYHAAPGEGEGRRRLAALSDAVARLWRARGAPYALDIDASVLGGSGRRARLSRTGGSPVTTGSLGRSDPGGIAAPAVDPAYHGDPVPKGERLLSTAKG